MYLLLSFLCGLIVSTMNIFNGQLSAHCGAYLATVIIHLIGLITFTLIMFLKKQEISFKHHLPFILYTGGVIGVLTVIFNIIAVNNIGAALLTALGLLGQMIISIILEPKGWLGSLKRKLTPLKWLSLIIVTIGIGVMVK